MRPTLKLLLLIGIGFTLRRGGDTGGDGPTNGSGDSDGSAKPSQTYGGIDASKSTSDAQDAVEAEAEQGRSQSAGSSGTPTEPPKPSAPLDGDETGKTPPHLVVPEPGDTIVWPPNNGFDGDPVTTTLNPGERMDRYGHPGGTFVAEAGTPYPQRALPPGSDGREFHTYEVVKPFEVQSGPAAPWFGEPGGGTQHLLPKKVQDLIDEGYIVEVDPPS